MTSVIAVGCLVLLSMYMVDRQWRTMAQMRTTLDGQAQDLRELRRTLQSFGNSVVMAPVTPSDNADELQTTAGSAFSRALLASQQPDFAEGDWLVRAFPAGLKTITPLISSDLYAFTVQSYVLESLLKRDPDTLEWTGLLAESWHTSDDGLTIDFKLRDDVAFADGKPVTAHDVAFSFRFVMDEAIAAPRHRGSLEKIATVKALDDRRVQFVFAEPYFESLGLAGQMDILAQHFYEPWLDKAEEYNQSKGILFGSGPYQLEDPTSWTPDGGRVELSRNQRYWGDVQPAFEKLIWNVIENDSARLAAFRNGTIDSYSSTPREYQKLLDDKQLQDTANNLEYMSPTAGYSFIGWNSEREGKPTVFADSRVRRAMTLLSNRQRIVDDVMLGYAEIAVSPFNPRSVQHDPQIKAWPADTEAAKALLTEAGFNDSDGDGVLENSEGTMLEFELVYYQDSDVTRSIVLLLKDLYARAGVSLLPKPAEWSVMIDLLNTRNFDAITLGWGSGVETDVYQMFHSSQIEDGGDNFINYRNAGVDALIDKARATVDEQDRMPLWWQVEALLHEDQPYTFLMRKQSIEFVDKRIRNIDVNRLGLNITQVPVENYVPANQQKYQP